MYREDPSPNAVTLGKIDPLSSDLFLPNSREIADPAAARNSAITLSIRARQEQAEYEKTGKVPSYSALGFEELTTLASILATGVATNAIYDILKAKSLELIKKMKQNKAAHEPGEVVALHFGNRRILAKLDNGEEVSFKEQQKDTDSKEWQTVHAAGLFASDGNDQMIAQEQVTAVRLAKDVINAVPLARLALLDFYGPYIVTIARYYAGNGVPVLTLIKTARKHIEDITKQGNVPQTVADMSREIHVAMAIALVSSNTTKPQVLFSHLAYRQELEKELADKIANLSNNERHAIRMWFGLDGAIYSQKQISEAVPVSAGYLRIIIDNILAD